jgi:hypothetical protein
MMPTEGLMRGQAHWLVYACVNGGWQCVYRLYVEALVLEEGAFGLQEELERLRGAPRDVPWILLADEEPNGADAASVPASSKV